MRDARYVEPAEKPQMADYLDGDEPYTSDGKRRSSQTHARRVRTCVYGKVCRGNGGWSSHRRAVPARS